jgi:hypothetical protein
MRSAHDMMHVALAAGSYSHTAWRPAEDVEDAVKLCQSMAEAAPVYR